MRTTNLLRSAGFAVITGALVASTLPAPALAEASTQNQGSQAQGQGPAGQAPEPPSGSAGGAAPDGPGAQAPSGQPGEPPSGGNGGGADTMTYDYTGTYSGVVEANGSEQTSDGETFSATEADQNALLAQDGGKLTVSGATASKSGDDSDGDRCNFYGANSIGLAVGEGSQVIVSDSSLATSSKGSNGLFATNSGTVYANNDAISTSADNSRGLDATYAGTVIANNMEIATQGNHSAATATDRGGGSVSLTNSSLQTAGSGSPLIYSTGDIEVSGVTGTASSSQIAGMEGLNTVLVNNSQLASTNTGTSGSDPVANGIIIYQSTSGDAEATTGEAATFDAVDSTLKSDIASGSMFYLTNTTANVVLQNTTLDFDSSSANLLEAAGNSSNNWGSAGSNGATVNFCGRSQTMSGNVVADTISTANVYLLEGTTWTGAAYVEQNDAGSTSEAPITINVDGTSSWVVTDSCSVSNLNVAQGGKVVDAQGRTVSIVANGQTVVKGDSDLTITVTGSYGTTVDAGDETQLATQTIDRSGFDSSLGTSTTFSLGDSSVNGSDSNAAQASATQGDGNSQAGAGSPLQAVIDFLKGLLGLD